MKKQDENRFSVRLDDLTRFKVEMLYKQAGCKSRNEFVERAVNFYADYLAGLQNDLLPTAIQSAINGRLGLFEDRMASLLYKLAVEMDMGISTLTDCVELDEDYLRKRRAESVKNVNATHGRLSFEQKVRAKDNVGDGPWQD